MLVILVSVAALFRTRKCRKRIIQVGTYVAVCISMHWEHISQVGIPHKCARSDICADHNQSNLDNTSATLVQLFRYIYVPTYLF